MRTLHSKINNNHNKLILNKKYYKTMTNTNQSGNKILIKLNQREAN